VLAVNPAIALSVTINPKWYLHQFGSRSVLFEDFDSIQNTPRRHHHRWLCSRSRDNGLGSPRAIGNFIVADGALGTSLNVTVTLSDPVSYVGFAWGTPDPMNEDAPPYNGSTFSAHSLVISP
jgi:hypothetical protein